MTELQVTARRGAEPLLRRAGRFVLGLAAIVVILVVIGLFLRGVVWASQSTLVWLIHAAQIAFALCVLVFLPFCIFKKTRGFAGFGFHMASYVFGTELLAYSCIVAFTIWGYTGLIFGLFLGGVGVVPVALFAALYAAVRHQTQWGLSGDILLMIILTVITWHVGVYLMACAGRERESGRPVKSSPARLATYAVVGLIPVVAAFVWSNTEQARSAYGWILRTGRTVVRQPLSPVELFQRVSPSVFVVEALDEDGKTLMLGSGVAMARDFLITNCHVVQSSFSLRVSQGKEHWTARLIQAAPNHDLCGLRPKSSGQIATSVDEQGRVIFTDDSPADKPSRLSLSPVNVRPSSTVATGERVYAIGAPEGLELTFSEGVVSALRDTEGVHMIQTSAAISPGSSGGGLFDAQGNLVGVTSFYLKEGQSLNFALPGEWVSGMLSSSAEAAEKSSARLGDAALESRAWLEIGLEAVKKNDYDVAIDSFRKCADLKESDASRAWLELGYLGVMATYNREFRLSKQEAQKRAIFAFEKAIEIKPDYAQAWLELAIMHDIFREEYGAAIAAAKEATRLAPGEAEGWSILGDCYIKTGSYAEAIDALQQGEKVAPTETKSSVLALLGKAHAKKGDREEVLRIYQELKGSDPKKAEEFFRECVLPKPAATAQPKKMSQRDQLLSILRNAPIDDATRDKAWEAFYQASSPDDLGARLNKLNIPDTVKQSIYDLRFRKP